MRLSPNQWEADTLPGSPPVTGKGAVTLIMSANTILILYYNFGPSVKEKMNAWVLSKRAVFPPKPKGLGFQNRQFPWVYIMHRNLSRIAASSQLSVIRANSYQLSMLEGVLKLRSPVGWVERIPKMLKSNTRLNLHHRWHAKQKTERNPTPQRFSGT